MARTNPAKSFSKDLRYFSYSIPLACIMTLIVGPIIFFDHKVAAKCFPGSMHQDQNYYTFDSELCEEIPNLTPTETFEINKTTSTTPTASLSIDNKTSVADNIKSSYGTTNYASHTISVSVTGAGSYDLILSGPAKLSGPSTINATSGATGANLTNDTWGYAWENTNVTDANASYKALGPSIKLTGDALSNQAASFSKKLAFAAKFSENSIAGIYHADVSLSLVATPKYTTTTITATNAVPWDKLVYMQDMTNYACMQAEIGDSKTLIDIRDRNTYTIAKLSDDKCWTTQNLRIVDLRVSKFDTNLTPNTYGENDQRHIPASATIFSSTDPANGQVKSSTDNDYGAYYSFNAATAGTAASKTSGSAEYDICPKGWRLLTSTEYTTLYDKYPTPTGFAEFGSKKGYWIGGASLSAGGAFFQAAGIASTSVIANPGTRGYYWSSTISSATSAYLMDFYDSIIYPANTYNRSAGFSVRCVAK